MSWRGTAAVADPPRLPPAPPALMHASDDAGFPSVGKSTLLNKLTGTFSEARARPGHASLPVAPAAASWDPPPPWPVAGRAEAVPVGLHNITVSDGSARRFQCPACSTCTKGPACACVPCSRAASNDSAPPRLAMPHGTPRTRRRARSMRTRAPPRNRRPRWSVSGWAGVRGCRTRCQGESLGAGGVVRVHDADVHPGRGALPRRQDPAAGPAGHHRGRQGRQGPRAPGVAALSRKPFLACREGVMGSRPPQLVSSAGQAGTVLRRTDS